MKRTFTHFADTHARGVALRRPQGVSFDRAAESHPTNRCCSVVQCGQVWATLLEVIAAGGQNFGGAQGASYIMGHRSGQLGTFGGHQTTKLSFPYRGGRTSAVDIPRGAAQTVSSCLTASRPILYLLNLLDARAPGGTWEQSPRSKVAAQP